MAVRAQGWLSYKFCITLVLSPSRSLFTFLSIRVLTSSFDLRLFPLAIITIRIQEMPQRPSTAIRQIIRRRPLAYLTVDEMVSKSVKPERTASEEKLTRRLGLGYTKRFTSKWKSFSRRKISDERKTASMIR